MIVLIGPTGETARRILAQARAAGVEMRLVARNVAGASARLGSLVDGYAMTQADATDPSSVAKTLEKGDVLINATTPAGQLGHGLARAAISAGAHYVAFTGEVVDGLKMLWELDGAAREAKVTLCPGAGSSGAVNDLAIRLALRQLPDATDGFMGAAVTGFTASYGTMLSAIHIMNGPGVVVRDGALVTEDVSGLIFRRNGATFVERPLIDTLMVSSYSYFRNLRAGIEVPDEAADEVSRVFRDTADMMKSAKRQAEYLETIAASAGNDIPENDASPEGTRIGMVWNGDGAAQVTLSARPVYELTARAALFTARELAEGGERPSGFQAVSTIARSLDEALSALGSRILP